MRVRKHVNPLSQPVPTTFSGFQNTNPLWVDVGACYGGFTEALSEQFPSDNVLALEIRTPLLRDLQETFAGNPRIEALGGDAGLSFRELLLPSLKKGAKVRGIFVNFPDPWPKDRHKKRRFITKSFLEGLRDWFPLKTPFLFQTDHAGIAADTLDLLNMLDFITFERFHAPPFGLTTHWERQKVSEGAEITRLKFWLCRL